MKKLSLYAASLLAYTSLASGKEYNPSLAKETFDFVWNKVDQVLPEKLAAKTNWLEVKAKYQSQLKDVTSSPELRKLLNKMLGELKLSHFAVFQSKKTEETKNSGEGSKDYLGIDLRYRDHELFIFDIDPDSVAAKAGLKSGHILEKFEGSPVSDLLEKYDLSPEARPLPRVYALRSILEDFSSPADGKTTLEIRDGKQIFDFAPGTYQGETASVLNISESPISFNTDRIGPAQKIHLIEFDSFMPSLMQRIIEAVKLAQTEKAEGLIFDLRGNPGGFVIMAPGIIGRLIAEDLDLGDLNVNKGNFPLHAHPQAGAYLGPIAVLVDSLSGSTSEIFAAALQEHDRAHIFGRPTTGAVLPSIIEKLPTGDHFQYAVGDFITAKEGNDLEGVGVTPDVQLPHSPEQLIKGTDPDLQAALEWLKTQNSH